MNKSGFTALLLDVHLFTELELVGKLPFACAPFAFWLASRFESRFLRVSAWLLLAVAAGAIGVLGNWQEPYDY